MQKAVSKPQSLDGEGVSLKEGSLGAFRWLLSNKTFFNIILRYMFKIFKNIHRGFLFMKRHFKKVIFLVVLISVSLFFAACENPAAVEEEAESYWPRSTPEAQGMDSEALLEMLEFSAARGLDIHSMLIVRNGHMVVESDFYPYRSDALHMVHSITKNVTATLVGIAIEEGYIESVDQKMVELLPDLDLTHLDERIKDITVEDLLTMQTGIYWGGAGSASSYEMFYESDNQLMYALEKEFANDPGEVHEYNSGSTHILSVILTEATGKSTREYGEEKLFEPLGISDIQWAVDLQGYYMGGDMLLIKPKDLAKFGLLYLQQGVWEGEQIVPKDWVEISTQNHVEQGYYGYSWWIPDMDGYVGSGIAGQHLVILPEEDMVVVITSGVGSRAYGFLNTFTKNWILGAVADREPIDENEDAYTRLQEKIEQLDSPDEAFENIDLPDTAAEISGNTYLMDNGESFTFEFTEDPEATLIWHREGMEEEDEVIIGLDNVFRGNRIENFVLSNQIDTDAMIRGHWEDDTTFILDFKCLENPMAYFYEFQFEGDSLHHTRTNRLNNSVYLEATGTVSE